MFLHKNSVHSFELNVATAIEEFKHLLREKKRAFESISKREPAVKKLSNTYLPFVVEKFNYSLIQ